MPKILSPACLRVNRPITAASIKTILTSERSTAGLPAGKMCKWDTQEITLMFPKRRFRAKTVYSPQNCLIILAISLYAGCLRDYNYSLGVFFKRDFLQRSRQIVSVDNPNT